MPIFESLFVVDEGSILLLLPMVWHCFRIGNLRLTKGQRPKMVPIGNGCSWTNGVGSKCLAALLGMGNSRLHNASRGCVDLLYGAFGFVPWFSLEPSWYWIFRSFFTLKLVTSYWGIFQTKKPTWGKKIPGGQANEGWCLLDEIVPECSWNVTNQAPSLHPIVKRFLRHLWLPSPHS